jgi:hypothetical protein
MAGLALVAGAVHGQVSIRTDVDTTLVTVGDRITLTVSVDHPSGASVVWPDSIDLSPFEVLGAQAMPPQDGAAGRTSAAVFLLTAFELGELEIPSFEVAVLAADGGRELLETDRFGIEVVTVGADETGDIREIRGPFSIPVSVVRVAGWLLVLLLLLSIALFAYRRWRLAPHAEVVDAGPPPRPAHEIALEALDRLESSPLLSRGEVKGYHIEVSEILRRYVEGRFTVPALEMTTWEIAEGLERAGVGQEFREGLRRFLDQCDLVKFAKVRPDAHASHEVLELGRRLVRDSIGYMAGIDASPEPTAAVEVEV